MEKWWEKCQNDKLTTLLIILEEWTWRLQLPILIGQLASKAHTCDYWGYQANNDDAEKSH